MNHIAYLENCISLFNYYKSLADKARDTLTPEQWYIEPAPGSNSMFILMRHMWGNMNSRWRDFLTSDGEKEDRHRDQEFVAVDLSTEEVIRRCEDGWSLLFSALEDAKTVPADYIVYIRNEGHTIEQAVQRQLAHYSYHVGQMVYLSKMIQGEAFKSLSVPRNASVQYNTFKFKEEKGTRFFTERIHKNLPES